MTWAVAFRLGRVSNLPTVWTNVLAGTVLAGGTIDWRFAFTGLSLSLFYVGGMYLNDAFDYAIDVRERPSRPIPSGQVTAGVVFVAGFVMLALGLGLLGWLSFGLASRAGWSALAAGVVLALAIIAYDAWHKGNPLSPVLMGICRALVYVTAGLLIAVPLPGRAVLAAAVAFCYLIGLTYLAKQETLRRVETFWPVLFLAVPFLYGLPIAASGGGDLFLYAFFLAWVAYAMTFLILPERIDIPRAVVSLIAGISLLDALLIAGQGSVNLAWIAVAGFALTLLLQRFVAGT